MLLFVLIGVILCGCSTLVGQESNQSRPSQQSISDVPASYRQTLEHYQVGSDATSAIEYLRSLTEDERIEQVVEQWISKLESPKFQVRQSAENGIVSVGPAAIKLIRQAAEEGDTETRFRAKRCIKAISDQHERILSAAVGVLVYDPAPVPSAEERFSTVVGLIRDLPLSGSMDYTLQLAAKSIADETTKSSIVAGTSDENPSVRIACVQALPQCMSKAELAQFQKILTDSNPMVALEAIQAIGFTNPRQSAKHLVSLLDTDEPLIRNTAVSLLRSISGNYFEYQYDANDDKRQTAVQRWSDWLSQTEIDSSMFRRLGEQEGAAPRGYLVSVTGSRVQEYDLSGKQVWESIADVYDAQVAVKGQIVVCERSQDRVRVIDRTGKTLRTLSGLDSPADAEILLNGNYLVAEGSGKVTEHSPTGTVLRVMSGLTTPFDADRLSNGNTLVADSGNDRIVEFDPAGNIVWEKNDLSFPNNVFRLNDGRTLYTTFRSARVVMLDAQGEKIWEQRLPNAILYSVYCDGSKIYVADGASSKIWQLGMDGLIEGETKLPVSFCDVSFVTK